jgi:hypothetical protein
MSAIRSAFREIVGLFIDDSALALFVVAVVAVAVVLHILGVLALVVGSVLLFGSVGSLVASVLRGARPT